MEAQHACSESKRMRVIGARVFQTRPDNGTGLKTNRSTKRESAGTCEALTIAVAAIIGGWAIATLTLRSAAAAEVQTAAEETRVITETPGGEVLEAMGATIGKIVLLKDNVFDPSEPAEDKWLYQLANRWHVVTRDAVIRQQLLFEEGDRFSQRLLDESARLLRRNDYLFTATVEPLRYADGVVDIAVRTRDVWTLRPGISMSRSGGENKTRASLSETNLLGTGAHLRLAYTDDVDRQSTSFLFSDNNLGESWLSLALELSDNSDGNTAALDLLRPFYALDSHWSAGFQFLDDAREDRLYELGNEVAESAGFQLLQRLRRLVGGTPGRLGLALDGWRGL